MLLVMPQEGIIRIGIVVVISSKGAESDSGVLELLGDPAVRVGCLELGEGHLGVVPVEVVAASGVPVGKIISYAKGMITNQADQKYDTSSAYGHPPLHVRPSYM